MDYINSFVDYLKSIFSHYFYNRNSDIDDCINTLESVKIIDKKIGDIDEVINILNEIAPKIFSHMKKKKYKFNRNLLLNTTEINYILKWIENYQKERKEPVLENYTVEDVIFNTNLTFIYNKMVLIKQRYEIIEEYSNSNIQ